MSDTLESKSVERPNQLKILVSNEEKVWLERLATAKGLTSSDWVRQQIREAHEALDAPLPEATLRKLAKKLGVPFPKARK